MNFPQYWARGRSGDFFAWRWSSASITEAQALADQAAQSNAERFRANALPCNYGGYYPNRPFREQILHDIKNDAGEVAALVTRNSYGCQVLNTANVMFVDIDLPEPPPPPGLLSRLFGSPKPAPALITQAGAIATIESWTRNNPEWGWRVYRTRAGLRLIATQALIDAGAAEVEKILDALGADPLYGALCKTQKCFRARLTPKPWRCGIDAKPERWPFLDAKREKRFQKWEAEYQNAAAEWATCELIRHIGNATIHAEVRPILKLHDHATRAESKLELA